MSNPKRYETHKFRSPAERPSSIPDVPISFPTLPPQGADAEDTSPRIVDASGRDLMQRGMLTVISGLNAGQAFSLDTPKHVLGRGSEADLWIEDPGVSRRHAYILREGDSYVLVDEGSMNGTFVRGEQVKRCALASGDRIQLGPNVMLSFTIVDDAEEELRKRMYDTSTRDSLTRAFNRQYFFERLGIEIAHSRRHGLPLGLIMIDIDSFKAVNDTYGHLAGDLVLRVVCAQIHKLIRTEDLLARYGGEEFVILARQTSKGAASRLAERIRINVQDTPIDFSKDKLRVTVSAGVSAVAELPTSAHDDDLIKLADHRLYAAKHAGRNRVINDGAPEGFVTA